MATRKTSFHPWSWVKAVESSYSYPFSKPGQITSLLEKNTLANGSI
jgi:hypothetical protein